MMIFLYISFVCYFPLISIFMPRFPFVNINLQWVIFYILLLYFIFEITYKRSFTLPWKWFSFLTLFSFISLVSVSWSNYSYFNFDTIRLLFFIIIAPFFASIITGNLFASSGNIQIYFKHISLAAAILGIISTVQMILGLSIVRGHMRSVGTFENPNALAIFLVLSLPCVMYVIERKLYNKFFGYLLISLIVSGIVCTVSRKGIITMIMVFIIYDFLQRNFKRFIAFSIAGGIAVLILAGSAIFFERFNKEEINDQIQGKWAMTIAGWEMFKTKPISGLGFKGYFENFGKYFRHSRIKKYDSHNMYITVLANYGLLGFIPFMMLFIFPLAQGVKPLFSNKSKSTNTFTRDTAIVCTCSILAFCANGFYAGGILNESFIMTIYYANIISFMSSLHT